MYDDFWEYRPNNKEMAVIILVVVVFMVVIYSIGYMCGIRNAGKDIPDNGNAAQHVRTEIESAGSNIGAAKSGIDNAAAAAGRIEERIADAQERADYLKGTADEGRRIIAECQSILREVRSRGKEKTPQN